MSRSRCTGAAKIRSSSFCSRVPFCRCARALQPRCARAARPAFPEATMSQALHPMLNIAIKAARGAGAIINRASLDIDRLQVTSKGVNDFVTEVDHAAEASIIDTLLAAYPGARHPGRGVGQPARRERQRLRLDHRPARRHHQLHPRPADLRGLDRALAFATRSSRPSSTTRPATISSSLRRAAAPSSTTSACASPSALAWPKR